MNIERVTEIAKRLCERRAWSPPAYIDHGASAAVYRAETPNGPAALKIYDPAFFEGDNALIEERRIALQCELREHGCPYLIDVFDAGQIAEDCTWFLLMEFCAWKSLEKRLAEVPDEKIHSLLKQLVYAIQFLDSKGLVHRDIKPANILVSDEFDQLKLLDFGVMRRIAYDAGSGTDGYKFIATAQYSPPEFLLREEAPGDDGFRAINLYQVGAVLHDLITKIAIFSEEKATKNKFKLFKAVTEKRPRIVSASVPPRLIALCSAALDKDPIARLASLRLEDFLADADDLDALRRRVSLGNRGRSPSVVPTLATWSSKVRSWGKEAAQLEVEALGAVTMKSSSTARRQRWRLDFVGALAPIYLDLVRVEAALAVHVLSMSDEEQTSPVLFIDAGGPSLPETGIPGALAAQYLYALDLALAARASAKDVMEDVE